MVIAGAKGFAKELLQVYYRDISKREIYFFDNINKHLEDKLYDKFPIIKSNEELSQHLKNDSDFALGIGTPKARKTLYDLFMNLKGTPISVISKRTNIGNFGTFINEPGTILDGVTITNDILIGKGTLINLNCTIGHDSRIGDFCDISPNVNISGHCTIGNYCSIGTGTVIIPRINIGYNVTIGAGAVVTKNIPNNSLCVGVPAKVIKELEPFFI